MSTFPVTTAGRTIELQGEEIVCLRRQRDELLAAAKAALAEMEDYEASEQLKYFDTDKQLRTAIQNAEQSKEQAA